MTKAQWILQQDEPGLLIGSTLHDGLEELLETPFEEIGRDKLQGLINKYVEHLRNMVKLYEIQDDAGRAYVHEHPLPSWSWDLKFMKEFRRRKSTIIVCSDACQNGQWSIDVDQYQGLISQSK